MSIAYEFDLRPEPGDVNEVADGIEWLRMPLPFARGELLRKSANSAVSRSAGNVELSIG